MQNHHKPTYHFKDYMHIYSATVKGKTYKTLGYQQEIQDVRKWRREHEVTLLDDCEGGEII